VRTRWFALVLALALPGLAAAEDPDGEAPPTFAPLDLRDPEPAPPAAAVAPSGPTDRSTPAPDQARGGSPAAAGTGRPAEAKPTAGPAPLGLDPNRDTPPTPTPAFAESPFAVGLKADLLVPTSQVDSTGALSLELRYRLPFHERRLAVAADAGWYPLGGEGKSVDPQQGTFAFEWRLDSLPVHLGLEYLPPLPIRLPAFLAGLRPYGEAGFAMAFLWSKATYRNAAGETFIRDNLQKDTAVGWYAGAGGLVRLGPGDLVGGYRYDGLKTDLDLPVANRKSGDVGGSHVQAGYRLVF
jgi:hypothetical protein